MITLTYSDGGMGVNLSRAPQVTSIQLQKWMTKVMALLHRQLNQNMSGGLVGRRTGNLMRALTESVTVTAHGVKGEIFPDPKKAIYGAIQEFGGTIVPKRAAHLTIPMPAMLTGNGVARGRARDVIGSPGAFGFQNTFVNPSRTMIFGRQGNETIPLFALVTSVTLPGKFYLATTLMQNWAVIADMMEQTLKDVVNVVFEGGSA